MDISFAQKLSELREYFKNTFSFLKEIIDTPRINTCFDNDFKKNVFLSNFFICLQLSNELLVILENSHTYHSCFGTCRTIIEICADLENIIKDKKNSDSLCMKQLISNDLKQDIKVYNKLIIPEISYIQKIHRQLSEYFPEILKKNNIETYNNHTSYTDVQIQNLLKLLKDLPISKSLTDKCTYFLKNVSEFANDEESQYKMVYPILCKYTHLNLSASENYAYYLIHKSINKNYESYFDDIYFSLSWAIASLKYILFEFEKIIPPNTSTPPA